MSASASPAVAIMRQTITAIMARRSASSALEVAGKAIISIPATELFYSITGSSLTNVRAISTLQG